MEKELDMKSRRRIDKAVAERYQRARKKEKSKILDEFAKTAQYNRAYASWLLRNLWRKTVILAFLKDDPFSCFFANILIFGIAEPNVHSVAFLVILYHDSVHKR